jgi:hypothetical protein
MFVASEVMINDPDARNHLNQQIDERVRRSHDQRAARRENTKRFASHQFRLRQLLQDRHHYNVIESSIVQRKSAGNMGANNRPSAPSIRLRNVIQPTP